jgi:hypothetical protein
MTGADLAAWPAGTGAQSGIATLTVTTCRHCGQPIALCSGFTPHAGCGSAFGWIHLDPNWGHSCQPRAGAPYAQPAQDQAPVESTAAARRPLASTELPGADKEQQT